MKIQIIEQVLSSFSYSKLSSDDLKCLMDHLAKEASLLLRKIDRCRIFLEIVKIDGLEGDFKYIDQMINTLNQLPDDSDDKFSISCELLEHLLVNPKPLRRNEQLIYETALKESKRDPSKEIKFYSIKLKHDSTAEPPHDPNTHETELEPESEPSVHAHPFSDDNTVALTELTSDDIQKLKIFQSFDLE